MGPLAPPGFRFRGLVEDSPHVGRDVPLVDEVVAPPVMVNQQLVVPSLPVESLSVDLGDILLGIFPTIRIFPTNFLQ